MPRSELNDIFDLGEDYYSGYFSDTELTDIKSQYIGSVVDLDALTKISRQLDVSMGSMMGMVNGFAIMIYMVLIYLLSKIIIEKNAQSISMVKYWAIQMARSAGYILCPRLWWWCSVCF